MSNEKDNQSFGKWLREPQTMIGLSAILLSICGLFISLYQTSLDRQYQRASVWPNVEIGPSFTTGQLAFHVTNTGIGPAKIEAVNVTYKGNVMQTWQDLLVTASTTDTTTENRIDFNHYRSLINSDVLPPASEGQGIFRISIENNKENEVRINKFIAEAAKGNVNITLCYCSVYDECWITTMIDKNKEELAPGSQKPIESCKDVENSNI